jgi:ubiquitin carboxyl-terminal hydrolase 14
MEVESKSLIVKHNKDNHKISTCRTSVLGLKEELQAITNVLVPRQKLLFKGKVLSDDESLLQIPENSTLTLLGNPEKDLIISNISNKVLFKEDLTKEDMLKIMKEKGEEFKYGLKNLGNTCYFNALIQCCGRVDPLRKSLIELSKTSSTNSNLERLFCQELGKVYESLENTTQPIIPGKLVQQLRILNPAFAENENGYYKQQDADECLGLMINIFKNSLKNNSEGEKFSDNLAEELFGVSLDISMTNIEDNSEI